MSEPTALDDAELAYLRSALESGVSMVAAIGLRLIARLDAVQRKLDGALTLLDINERAHAQRCEERDAATAGWREVEGERDRLREIVASVKDTLSFLAGSVDAACAALAPSLSEEGSVECDCGNPAVATPDGQHHVFCASLIPNQEATTT